MCAVSCLIVCAILSESCDILFCAERQVLQQVTLCPLSICNLYMMQREFSGVSISLPCQPASQLVRLQIHLGIAYMFDGGSQLQMT